MKQYQKSKIYAIRGEITGLQYIGSTTQELSQRKAKHVLNFNMWLEDKYGYCTSFAVIQDTSHYIILLEECPCDSVNQLRAIERKWIENNECVNKYIPTRTHKEYYNDPEKQFKQQMYLSWWRAENKDKTSSYREKGKMTQKIYRQNNPDKIRKWKKEYYQRHKEAIKKKAMDRYYALKS